MRTTKPADELDLDGDADCTCDAVDCGGGFMHREWCGRPMFGPMRIQRRRIKGWRMPEGAIYVGRPTKWGNPANWSTYVKDDGESVAYAHQLATEAFEDGLAMGDFPYPSTEQIRAELGGKDLACWCREDQVCHADVLLQIANGND